MPDEHQSPGVHGVESADPRPPGGQPRRTFEIQVTVRSSDLDTNGHVRGPVYLDYADHARWEAVRAAGVSLERLHTAGLGPINLETTIRFHHELRVGDHVDVQTAFVWGEGKTFQVAQELRGGDGTLAATIASVSGLLDLQQRRLVPHPRNHWQALATRPELLGL